jgi:deazaflavin-dependent oxidoreductase (nitroreductase family)
MDEHTSPGLAWRMMRKLNGRIARNYQKGFGPTRVVLLLTTTGRKSGQPRVTPLQYEEYDGVIYIGSARGAQADWFRNIQVDPRVEVQIRQRCFSGQAEAVTDPARIADFLEMRLQRHPLMIGLIMRLEGLPWKHTRPDLERFAAAKALAIIRPRNETNHHTVTSPPR